MTADQEIHIPAGWQQLQLSHLHGILMIIGATDVGTTTFAPLSH